MIGYLKGKIQCAADSYILVNCSGVGYKVEVKDPLLQKIGGEGEFFIYTHVRENELRLFGFPNRQDLEIFEFLLDVNGVGPKAAMTIISNLGSRRTIDAILQKDANLLKVPGVGIKTANKIILDLVEKLKKKGFTLSTKGKNSLENKESKSRFEQANEALEALGYSKKDIEKATEKINFNKKVSKLTTEEFVKYLLKYMR